MKTKCEALKKLGQLVQSHIATATGNGNFVAAECNDQGLLLTATDEEGLRRQFRITAEDLTEPDAAASTEATECCGSPTECSQEGAEGPVGETAESSVPPAAEECASADGSADQPASSEHPAQPQAASAAGE